MKTYTKRLKIPPCRMGIGDLKQLVELTQEGLTDEEIEHHFSISTKLQGIEISEASITEFLKHKELPHVLNERWLFRHGWGNNARVHILLGKDTNSGSVEGPDEVWVNGKATQIMNFLNHRKAPLWFWLTRCNVYVFTLVFIFYWVITLLDFLTKNSQTKLAADSFSIVQPLVLFYTWYLISLQFLADRINPYTKITLKNQGFFASLSTGDKIAMAIFVVGLVTLLAIVLGVVLAILQLNKMH